MNKEEFYEELIKDDIYLSESQKEQLEKYYEMLVEYNQKVNLTSIVEKEEVYLKHFYDSITLNKIINLGNNLSLCDVGAGAGFPGMVIKIVFPKTQVTLVDSLNKRVIFLKNVIKELNLKDIYAIHSRAEDYGQKNREKFDVVTARAVTQLPKLIEFCVPITKENGYFIPLKSEVDKELELSKSAMKKLDISLEKREEFYLPKEKSKRTLLMFKKNSKSKKMYPRKPNEIKKMPL